MSENVVKNTTSGSKGGQMSSAGIKLQVEITDPKLCPRYQAVVLELPHKKPTNYLLPMQTFIARSGMRSIDRVVDITNELMLLTGQPLHAFDYDKLVKVGGLDTAKIIVRAAKKGEQLELLDGKTIEMDEGDIVITSNNVPVALAGAMGGKNTAIDESTRRIVVESATFNLYNLRGTQFRHGIFSEAITRFTKGQPPALTDLVIKKAIKVYAKHCDAKQISDIADAYPKKTKRIDFKIPITKFSRVLGDLKSSVVDYSGSSRDDGGFVAGLIEKTLKDIGYENVKSVSLKDTHKQTIKTDLGMNRFVLKNFPAAASEVNTILATAPYWRTDLHIPEDVIEDVGRLNGYDNIRPTLPQRDFKAVTPDALEQLKQKIRAILAAAGANEVLTYTFVHGDLLKKAGQDLANSYQIINAISPDLQYFRQSLTPSLLDRTAANLRDGFSDFALFEINTVHQKKWGLTDEKVPVEKPKVALVLTNKNRDGAAFYVAKKYLNELFLRLGIKAKFVLLTADNATDIPFENQRRAKVEETESGEVLGVIGEYKNSVRSAFKLPHQTAGFELIIDNILKYVDEKKSYTPLSRYPSVERDLTFRVSADLDYAELENLLCQTLTEQNLWFQLVPLSIYQGDDKSTKNISFRLTFADYQKTLTGQEIATIVDKITTPAKTKFKAEII